MTRELPEGMIEFRFYRPHVGQMSVAGDFNGWNVRSTPMTLAADGWWECRLPLIPGKYQFKYHGDGQWFTDYAAFGVERGPYGWNSVIRVPGNGRTAAA